MVAETQRTCLWVSWLFSLTSPYFLHLSEPTGFSPASWLVSCIVVLVHCIPSGYFQGVRCQVLCRLDSRQLNCITPHLEESLCKQATFDLNSGSYKSSQFLKQTPFAGQLQQRTRSYLAEKCNSRASQFCPLNRIRISPRYHRHSFPYLTDISHSLNTQNTQIGD